MSALDGMTDAGTLHDRIARALIAEGQRYGVQWDECWGVFDDQIGGKGAMTCSFEISISEAPNPSITTHDRSTSIGSQGTRGLLTIVTRAPFLARRAARKELAYKVAKLARSGVERCCETDTSGDAWEVLWIRTSEPQPEDADWLKSEVVFDIVYPQERILT